ncbi:MAG: hypothetical protein NT038_07775 [Euryarchaeota archaeon]|nr:hypothetical protein [Euryarchaeota archaeon]
MPHKITKTDVVTTKIIDMPKLESPFVRKMINNRYIVTPEIASGHEWVFEDDTVLAIEKINGTNVSILIEAGQITSIWNRKNPIPFFSKGNSVIVKGLLNSFDIGYCDLPDGQHFGELVGGRINGNLYNLQEPRWLPFETFCKEHLRYKSWGKYPKDFDAISQWFKSDLIPLFSSMLGNRQGYVEGVVFTHPDGRMSKLRKDMFDWYECGGHAHKME